MTTRDQIRGWLQKGRDRGATHMIVSCDGFDNEDYPVYVMPDEDARLKAEGWALKPMQSVMEVYRLDLSWDSQLAARRVRNF